MNTDLDRCSFLEKVTQTFADALSVKHELKWSFSMLPGAEDFSQLPMSHATHGAKKAQLRFKSEAFQQQLKDLQDTCHDVGDGHPGIEAWKNWKITL